MTSLLLIAATERELRAPAGLRTLCCGVGPVEAALSTGHALQHSHTDAVLHVGIDGARNLEPGAIVIGSESVYCDVLAPDTTLPRVAHAQPSQALLDAARTALPTAHVLPIATAARVGGGSGYAVEAMEGFGVLRAAELAGLPALEVRVISNDPEETDRGRWRIDDALAVLERTIKILAPALS